MTSVQKQDMIPLSASQTEPKTWNTEIVHTIHIDYLDRDCIERCMTTMSTLTAGGLGLENSCREGGSGH